MTETQSAHEFTDRAGQTASTERVTPATTEPERDAQFTSTAPAGQDEPAEPAQTTTARTPVTEEREISRIEKSLLIPNMSGRTRNMRTSGMFP